MLHTVWYLSVCEVLPLYLIGRGVDEKEDLTLSIIILPAELRHKIHTPTLFAHTYPIQLPLCVLYLYYQCNYVLYFLSSYNDRHKFDVIFDHQLNRI